MENRQQGPGSRPAIRVGVVAVVVLVLGVAIYQGSYRAQDISLAVTANSSASSMSTSAGSSSGRSESYENATSSASTSQSSTASPAPCKEPYMLPATNNSTLANGTTVTETKTPVFFVAAGSTMQLCVRFVDLININRSVSTSTELYTFSWPESPSIQTQPANNVSTIGTPENLSLSPGQSVVVEYEFTTGKNSTGFDGMMVGPLGALSCKAMRIAVGYQPSQINSSDFSSYYHGITECPTSVLVGSVIGYTGAGIVYLNSETRSTI